MKGGWNMRQLAIAAIIVALAAGPVLAQSPADGTPTRVAGTIEKLDGRTLTVARPDGQKQSVTLSADAKIFGVEKRNLTDIKPGDFVASGGVRGSDGKIHAVEVRIFPDELRGTGEGQRPWDARPEGVMTNATVGTVSQTSDGGVIHVTYKDGQSEYAVGPDVPVLAYVAGDAALLKPGAAILTIARKQADGSLLTNRVTAEKDGIKPPM
jgi:hypothetical protein